VTNWLSISSSADGSRLAASGYGFVFLSSDAGATWEQSGLRVPYWTNAVSVACSADGGTVVAAVYADTIYIYQATVNPLLTIRSTGPNLLVDWMIPSRPFVLQQSSGLGGGWTDAPTTPLLNYTNLHYEVSLPKPTGTAFYRLASR
jgi:hypothetical protein